jgi:UMF1 family MFS transporter
LNIRRFNPFRSLPNAREVWAWGMYDLANQSFTLLITTLFFGIYFKNVVVGEEGRGQLLYGRAFAISSLLVVITSPFLGALADFSGRKKAFLTWLGIGCSLFTMALALAGPDDTLLAMTLFIAANVCFMGGENFLAAFLPELSTRQTIGRVSAIGWTMGYLGALICLPMALLIPGLRDQTIGGFRGLFLFAGAWFLINALPTMLLLRERKQREVLPAGATLWTIGFLRVLDSARQAGRFRQLSVFLTFFCIYCCGMQVIIVFSGIIASKYLSPTALIAFVFVLAAVSAVGSAISGLYQDRIGQRLTVQVSLLIWIATSIGAVLLPDTNAPMWLLGLVGAGVGLGLGLTGAASRALVGVLTPAHKTAEFFALWGLGYKIAGIFGPLLFGLTSARFGQQWAMGLVGLFFLIGLVGTCFVQVDAGRRAAELSEREHADKIKEADIAAAARISASELREVERVAGEAPAPPADERS